MEKIEILRDSNIVKTVVAEAKKERLDSKVRENAYNLIKDLASNPTPDNRYQIAQLAAFAVNEIQKGQMNWLENVADVKNVGFNEKALFKFKLDGVRAFIQAKGATTARSKVAGKTVTLDTVAVSARPVLNLVEMRTNQAAMADLVNDAAYQMDLAKVGYIQSVLDAAAKKWEKPFYGSGTGIVKATFDPMIREWFRVSGGKPSILGDIDMTSKLAELTGFNSGNGNQQFADGIIAEQNELGHIGTYNFANVVNLVNPYKGSSNETVLNRKKLYVLPGGVDPSMRPLKVVNEGDVISMEATNIDDLTYEMRLDQHFGAGVVYGDRPYMSVYEDTTM